MDDTVGALAYGFALVKTILTMVTGLLSFACAKHAVRVVSASPIGCRAVESCLVVNLAGDCLASISKLAVGCLAINLTVAW